MPQDAGAQAADPLPFLLLLVFVIAGVWLAIVSFRKRSISGQEAMIGMLGKAATDISTQGKAIVGGVYYNARSISETIAEGSDIEVVDMIGITLNVRQVASKPQQAAEQ